MVSPSRFPPIGLHFREIAAAQKYDQAARELFGEHARPNFPDGIDAWLEQQTAPGQGEDAPTQTREAA